MAEYGKSQAVSQSKDTSEEKHSNRISETEESRTQESGTSSIKTSTNIASKGKAINLWGGGGGGNWFKKGKKNPQNPRQVKKP